MNIELPSECPFQICMESVSDSGSLPPRYAWSERLTLFGSGEFQSIKVNGYLPYYTTVDQLGEPVSDINLWSNEPSLSPLLEHITLIDGRLCLSEKTKINQLSFSWRNDDGSEGKVKIKRKKPSTKKIVTILSEAFNNGIKELPNVIGEPAPGSSSSSIIFCCKIDSALFKKEITFFSYNSNNEFKKRYYFLMNLINRRLNSINNPWWKVW